MVELKNRMSKHVKAAKTWLGKAEQSFDKDQNIIGELNLMLAQAELQRAQEAKTENQSKFNKYRLIHSILAAGIAGLVVVVGFSGWGFFNQKTVNSTPSHVNQLEQINNVSLDKNQNASLTDMKKLIVEKKVDVPNVASEVKTVNQKSESKPKVEEKSTTNSSAKEEVVNLPPAQMQNLMRAAGKSLRGQE